MADQSPTRLVQPNELGDEVVRPEVHVDPVLARGGVVDLLERHLHGSAGHDDEEAANGSLTSPPSRSAHHRARGTGSVVSTVNVRMLKVLHASLGSATDTAFGVLGRVVGCPRE